MTQLAKPRNLGLLELIVAEGQDPLALRQIAETAFEEQLEFDSQTHVVSLGLMLSV